MTKKEFIKFDKLIDALQDKHEKMDHIFWERSDAWQDSEKGDEFQEKMDAVQSAIDDLEMIKDDLKTAFDLDL
tara:strand:- start:1011 stop:1229 length:219 start_codon:yes stop_codon:yes gene_type:complete